MSYRPQDMPRVDAALRRAKDPLTKLRAQHGVTETIEWRLRYNHLGEIVVATVEHAPPGLSSAFIEGAIVAIRGTIVLPRPWRDEPGILNFIDLGPAIADQAAAINTKRDLADAEKEARIATRNLKIFMFIMLGIVAVALVGLVVTVIKR